MFVNDDVEIKEVRKSHVVRESTILKRHYQELVRFYRASKGMVQASVHCEMIRFPHIDSARRLVGPLQSCDGARRGDNSWGTMDFAPWAVQTEQFG